VAGEAPRQPVVSAVGRHCARLIEKNVAANTPVPRTLGEALGNSVSFLHWHAHEAIHNYLDIERQQVGLEAFETLY